jgi:hypothetical protein
VGFCLAFSACLTVYVSALRKALGEDAHRPIYVETVARSGYRFIASVTCDLAHEKLLTPSAITRPVELYDSAVPANVTRRFASHLPSYTVTAICDTRYRHPSPRTER